MMIGSLVPVDRANRDAGISAVRDAVKAIEQGLNMTIYIEGNVPLTAACCPSRKARSTWLKNAEYLRFKSPLPAPRK